MRSSVATRYARWSATAALLIVVLVADFYGRRAWQRAHAQQAGPPAVPPSVKQQSQTFSFSKAAGDRTLFTVRASRATEFQEGGKSQLEDVWITIYGNEGDRNDNLHTSNCDYNSSTGKISCAGIVQIDLEGAEEARRKPGQRVFHMETSGISFDRQSGEARTDQAVNFRFPEGQGRGVGLVYKSEEASVRVARDVQLTFAPGGRKGSGQTVALSGGGMDYRHGSGILRLLSPVRVVQGPKELSTGLLTLELSRDLRARRMTATDKPQMVFRQPQSESTIEAGSVIAEFAADGSIQRVIADGGLHGTRKSLARGRGEDYFAADRVEIEIDAQRGQPKLLDATGNVKIETPTVPGPGKRSLAAPALRLYFTTASGKRAAEVSRGETLAPGTIEIQSPQETTQIRGERLAAELGPRNHLRRISGQQGVEMERRLPGHAPQITRSQEGTIEFGPKGEWTEARQSGNLRFQEGERTARADRGRYARWSDTLTLSGSAAIADALTETTAPTLVFDQRSGEIRGQEGVRTTYKRADPGGITNLAPQPAHLTAQRFVATRDSARAIYSGRARMWQGDAVIEADTIELQRQERLLLGRGNVSALLPQARPNGAGKTGGAGGVGGGVERTLWLAHAGRLAYRSADGVAMLEENVRAESRVGRLESRALELLLHSEGGPQELTRAVATGGVTVHQEERRGTSERAEYVVADGKFVLSGGNPTIYDAEQGTTTGPQLTFFLADDRILVQSSEGTRTVTRHRIQK